MNGRSTAREIAALLLLSAFMGVTFNAFSPKGIPLVRTEPPKEVVADSALFGAAVPAPARADSASPYRTITLEQFRRLLDDRKGLLLDARTEEDYARGHIPGAKSVPGQSPDASFEHLAQISRDTLVVVYCNNPECHLGRMLIDFMKVLGYTNMVLYDDGWDGWLAAHGAVDSAAGGGGW